MATEQVFHIDVAPAHVTNFTVNSSQIAQHSPQIFDGADIAWVLTSGVLVTLMIAGISLLHSGLSDRHNAITTFRLPLLICAVVGCQWFLFGYSLAFSPRSSSDGWTWWGGTSGLLFRDVLANPVGNNPGARIPEVVYAFFQQMFACFAACIVSGATYRKVPTIQFLFFILIWTTVVYDPVARWSWHPQGWSRRNFSLDYAGGTVVHIISGAAVQAFAVWYAAKVKFLGRWNDEQRLEKRNAHLNADPPYQPHNTIFVVLGTLLMWIGWFGFNGGSALGINTRAASACMSTQISASFGAVTGLAWYGVNKWLGGERAHRESATIYLCDGALNGLVAITPAAGFVPPKFAPVFGVVATTAVIVVKTVVAIMKDAEYFWADIVFMQYDLLHVGIVHAGSGLVGMFLTAFLNRPEIFALDGFSTAEGYSQDAAQLVHQLKDAAFAWLYSFFVTLALLWLSTLIKLLLSKSGISDEPWKQETKFEVLNKHAWAAGEAQIATDDYELTIHAKDGTPSPTRNNTNGLGGHYTLGDGHPAANGGAARPTGRGAIAREDSS